MTSTALRISMLAAALVLAVGAAVPAAAADRLRRRRGDRRPAGPDRRARRAARPHGRGSAAGTEGAAGRAVSIDSRPPTAAWAAGRRHDRRGRRHVHRPVADRHARPRHPARDRRARRRGHRRRASAAHRADHGLPGPGRQLVRPRLLRPPHRLRHPPAQAHASASRTARCRAARTSSLYHRGRTLTVAGHRPRAVHRRPRLGPHAGRRPGARRDGRPSRIGVLPPAGVPLRRSRRLLGRLRPATRTPPARAANSAFLGAVLERRARRCRRPGTSSRRPRACSGAPRCGGDGRRPRAAIRCASARPSAASVSGAVSQ